MHYHVQHAQSENIYRAGNKFSALICAEDDIRTDSDMAYEDITGLGEAGDFEGAYHSFKNWRALANVHSNINNVIFQYQAIPSKRAPLFQGPDWKEKLEGTADYVISEVNSRSQVTIIECNDECEPEDGDE